MFNVDQRGPSPVLGRSQSSTSLRDRTAFNVRQERRPVMSRGFRAC